MYLDPGLRRGDEGPRPFALKNIRVYLCVSVASISLLAAVLCTPAAQDQEIVRILHTAEMRERVTNLGAEPAGLPRDDFARFLKYEAQKWGKLVRASGAKAE